MPFNIFPPFTAWSAHLLFQLSKVREKSLSDNPLSIYITVRITITFEPLTFKFLFTCR